MKKIVFRFWIINFLTSIALFFIYRIVIAVTKTIDGNLFEKLIEILELLLNIGFALIYLIAMVICSFAILLNLIEKIRNNFYWSLLTFLAIPSLCAICIIIRVLIDIIVDNLTVLTTLAIFSTLYVVFTTIQFLVFRKRMNKLQVE